MGETARISQRISSGASRLRARFTPRAILFSTLVCTLVFFATHTTHSYPHLLPLSETWVHNLSSHAHSVFSQGKQDGILEHIFFHVPPRNRRYVEFGFGYAQGDAGIRAKLKGTNTYYLKRKGWDGWIFDAVLEHKRFGLYKELLTPDNIVSVFEKHAVPHDVDYVSIDVDSLDLWLMRSLIAPESNYRPQVLTIEFNSNFPYESTVTCDPVWEPWRRDMVYGTSIGAIMRVAGRAGYDVVYVEGRLDVVLVRRDVLRRSGGRGLSVPELKLMFPMPSRAHKIKSDSRFYRFVDLDTFERTGDMELAREAAKEDVDKAKKLHVGN